MKFATMLYPGLSRSRRAMRQVALACAAMSVVGFAGCEMMHHKADAPPAAEPGATFTGEPYLRGTVQSYGTLINNLPLLVSGYGMVVDLNGTGSNEVPAFLRDWLITEMRRNNVGSADFGTDNLSPQRAMSDTGSSVVAVEGFIPPGATPGTKFDLLVTMIDQNSTSLSGGRLFWPTTLTQNGLNSQLSYSRPMASGYGAMYVNPISSEGNEVEFLRQALVVDGGTVTEARQIQMILNQRSRLRARQISDRINERFPAGREDRLPTAVAKDDLTIDFNIPERFSDNPEALIELIGHLYLDPTPGFAPNQAQYLADKLAEDPEGRARSVVASWKTLGRTITPVLRRLYDHENLTIRSAALEAGAWLQDREAVDPLIALTRRGDAQSRIDAARWLIAVNGVSRGREAIRAMLNDEDPAVRVGAYETLSLISDRTIERMAVGYGTQFKYYIDRVESDHPMIFATQADTPTLVIFGDNPGFRDNLFAQVGDNLMIRTIPVDTLRTATAGLHEGETAFVPVHWQGRRELLEDEVRTSLGADMDEPLYQTELGDRDGEIIKVRIRGQAAMDMMREQLLMDLPRSQVMATAGPASIAVVRLIEIPRRKRNADGTAGEWEGEYVAELLGLQDPGEPLPLAVRYQRPGSREVQTYRITPTVATLAFTLGYDRSEHLAKLGPDLPYSTVVQAIHQMCEDRLIEAPFQITLNEIAQRVEDAQRAGVIDDRPEFDLEEVPDPDFGPNANTPGDLGELTPLTPLNPDAAPSTDDRPE
ncbi:MAG: flagellar basal body P-ring protein FlgI [Phycisphaerales bacterium JB063]